MAAQTKHSFGSDNDNRGVVHELVYQELRQSIMVGTFTPGEKVSLRSLAQQVGTSLTPVRGAVNRLIAEGAFEVLPNRWVMIPSMTEEKFDEIIHWRIRLEMEATRRACRNATRGLIKKIESINKTMHKVVRQGRDRKDLLNENYKFHFTIYRHSKSTILLPMIESLWLQCGPFTYYSLSSPKDLWNTKHHHTIVDALKAGDADRAARAVKADITSTAKFLKSSGQYTQPRLRRIVG
ncbi:MAG: GntR family transcriptional regulator [Gammaproteobacteria bacterium]|nr:GntR family transcriptional regulator [Gammaproteobacteria bacterium]MDE0511432.1 GntR family transcriptional regulator [Gammaproteobacteria bacterium]